MPIRTVLCPVDFSPLDDEAVAVASEAARVFGAKLVLHHNDATAEPGVARMWDYARSHAGEVQGTERRLQALLNRVAQSVRVEAVLTSGPVVGALLAICERVPIDLVVLGSHGRSTEDHASVVERLARESPCPLLVFHEGQGAGWRLVAAPDAPPLSAVVATDLTADGNAAVGFACALARELPLRLDLLHVVVGDQSDDAIARAQAALDAHVPPDLVDRVRAHVRTGAAAEAITAYVAETMPAFVVIGEHAHGLIRRLFTRDTVRAVIHELGRPVLIVPPR